MLPKGRFRAPMELLAPHHFFLISLAGSLSRCLLLRFSIQVTLIKSLTPPTNQSALIKEQQSSLSPGARPWHPSCFRCLSLCGSAQMLALKGAGLVSPFLIYRVKCSCLGVSFCSVKFFFRDRVSCGPGWLQTPYVAEDNLPASISHVLGTQPLCLDCAVSWEPNPRLPHPRQPLYQPTELPLLPHHRVHV